MKEHGNPEEAPRHEQLQELINEYGVLAVKSLSGQRFSEDDSKRFAFLMDALSAHIDTESHYSHIATAMERSVCHDDCTVDMLEQQFSTEELIELYALKSSGVRLSAWQQSRYRDLVDYFLEQGRSVDHILQAAGFDDVIL